MKFAATCVLTLCDFYLAVAVMPAQATNEPTLDSLVTCQESWMDWKQNPARGEKFGENLHKGYIAKDEGYLVPKTKTALFGLPVQRVYPESIGMGVGFSATVGTSFDAAKSAMEKAIGKPLECEADSDEMHACHAQVGTKTAMVVSDTGGSKSALIGCFYFYEK